MTSSIRQTFSTMLPDVKKLNKMTYIWKCWCLVVLLAVTTTPFAGAVCPNGCTCNDDSLMVSCTDANLEVVPITLNPSIQRLVLRNTKIRTVDAAFQFYSELLHVDLSNNQVVSLSPKSFEAQRKLLELHLNSNKISSVNNKTFLGLKSVTVLSLRSNYLGEIPDRLFTNIPRLQELNLGGNSIERIDSHAFFGLTDLRILYLDDNKLKYIPSESLATVPNLSELHIGNNDFKSLPDKAFGNLQKLQLLDLSGAGLVNISYGAFQGVDSIRVLKLVDNSLKMVPTLQLTQLTRLEDLSIGQNNFNSIPSRAFQGLVRLRSLSISGAPYLSAIAKDAFDANLDLEILVMDCNKKLIQLPDGLLTSLPNLHQLSLKDNGFTSISDKLCAWSELKMVDLRDNPMDCTCSTLWLRDVLAQRNMSQAFCATPPELHGRALHQLTADDLSCTLHNSQQQAIIGVICASVAAVVLILVFVLYRYRKRVRNAFKDYKWSDHSLGKEHEYQKTLGDEDYIVRAAYNQQQTLKPIPVTEL